MKKYKVWYNHIVFGDLSQNKPNGWGVRRMPRYDPNANAYDEIAWGILRSKFGVLQLPLFKDILTEEVKVKIFISTQ